MKRLTSGSVGIQQGSRVLFSDYADGGVMWTGEGERESLVAVTGVAEGTQVLTGSVGPVREGVVVKFTAPASPAAPANAVSTKP